LEVAQKKVEFFFIFLIQVLAFWENGSIFASGLFVMVSKDRWNPHISAILFFIPTQSARWVRLKQKNKKNFGFTQHCRR
jgi:hypothetical protein